MRVCWCTLAGTKACESCQNNSSVKVKTWSWSTSSNKNEGKRNGYTKTKS